MTEDFLNRIDEAEMILVGLGEEFQNSRELKRCDGYEEGKELLKKNGQLWRLPVYDEKYRKKYCSDGNDTVLSALEKLRALLEDKNYFVVSTAINDRIRDIEWKHDRLVMPCGGGRWKQCSGGCEKELLPLTKQEEAAVNAGENLGCCQNCGKSYVLNNIYAENYNEHGYLEKWELYTKWLQGTLKHSVLVLELGVGLQFPSVIRWPFEKVTFLNQKAYMYRVHEYLYQLTDEIKEKAVSVPQNSIDWLLGLC